MLFYASGQLFNGIIGDHVKPKYMVTLRMAAALPEKKKNARFNGGWSQGEVGFELTFSAKSASKNQAIRQYSLIFVLSFNEKFLSQNCRALQRVHFLLQNKQQNRR